MQQIADCDINALDFSSTDTGEIMLAIRERRGTEVSVTTARSMSDGLLRFLAIATALSSPVSDLDVDALITTHSPALLDALSGDQLHDVLVCHHDQVSRLIDLPGYARAMSAGRLGAVVTSGALEEAASPMPDPHPAG